MAAQTAVSRIFAALVNRKTVGPIELVIALAVLVPAFAWDWGGHYEKPIRIVVLLGFLVVVLTSSISAWRGVNRPWMRPAIIAIDVVAGVVILATVIILLLKS